MCEDLCHHVVFVHWSQLKESYRTADVIRIALDKLGLEQNPDQFNLVQILAKNSKNVLSSVIALLSCRQSLLLLPWLATGTSVLMIVYTSNSINRIFTLLN